MNLNLLLKRAFQGYKTDWGGDAHFADQAICKLIKVQGLCIWAPGLRHMPPNPNFINLVYVYLACMPQCTCACQRTYSGRCLSNFYVGFLDETQFSRFAQQVPLSSWVLAELKSYKHEMFKSTIQQHVCALDLALVDNMPASASRMLRLKAGTTPSIAFLKAAPRQPIRPSVRPSAYHWPVLPDEFALLFYGNEI